MYCTEANTLWAASLYKEMDLTIIEVYLSQTRVALPQLIRTILAAYDRYSLNPLEWCRCHSSATSSNEVGTLAVGGWAVLNVTAVRPVYQSPYCCTIVRCSVVLMWPFKGLTDYVDSWLEVCLRRYCSSR